MRSIIMAGGSGTRLWPFSRKHYPKQFLTLVQDKSFIQLTADRLKLITPEKSIYTVAGEDYKLTIADHLSRCLGYKFENMIQEPTGRNTAPAIMLTMKYMIEKAGCDQNEILFFSPSDHIIRPEKDFAKAVSHAAELAKDNIVTFGIVPAKPETGYGYIELDPSSSGELSKVRRFVEKPDLAKAKEYLAAGNYLWNSGMFLFSIKVMAEAFREFIPELYKAFSEGSYEETLKNYPKLQSISIDYAVMEKAKNIVCRKLAIEWNDVGSWDSVYDIFPKDKDQNAISGDVITLNSKNNLVISGERLTTLIGVSDIAVIETDDAILVSDRKQAQDVKEITNLLKKNKRVEADDHTTSYRPWGNYTILEESERYKIKKITVKPGASLSLQRHKHRSEHWIVVRGEATVRIGEQEQTVSVNESVYVPKATVHRLANQGLIPLEIIEVQNGEYVGEDDIERLEDKYGRTKK